MSPHPSRRTIAIRQTVAVFICLFAAACVVAHLTGCPQPLTPQEKAQVADTTYAAEMVACVEKSSTIEGSRACRAAVRARWGVDGGPR